MLKRLPWLLLAIALPFLLQGVGGSAVAGDGFDVTGAEWTSFPDADPASGQFVAISGLFNAGLPLESVSNGEGPDPRQLVMAIVCPVVDGAEDVNVAVFDGDTKGLWDQRDSMAPVAYANGLPRPYETQFRLYPDPTGGVARALAMGVLGQIDDADGKVQPVDKDGLPETDDDGNVLPPVAPAENVLTTDSRFTGHETEWVDLASFEGDESAKVALPLGWPETIFPNSEAYVYTLRVNLLGTPSLSDLSEFECNGFKLAYTGVGRLPDGAQVGLIGGLVDSRTVSRVARSEDPFPGELIPGDEDRRSNGFKGIFDINLLNTFTCQDLLFSEADADWVDFIPEGEDPLGIPPDDGGVFQYTPEGYGPRTSDNTSYKITLEESYLSLPSAERPEADTYAGGLAWAVIDPDGDVRLSSNDSPSKHPSVTGSKQPDGPYQSTALAADVANEHVGEFWTWRWYGVDSRNLIWLHRSGDVGPEDDRLGVTGYVWCDDNQNGEMDAGEQPVEGATVEIEFVSAPTTPMQALVTTDPQSFTTDSDGKWISHELAAGTWQIVSVTQSSSDVYTWSSNVPFPQTFLVTECEDDEVLTPGTCTESAGISGRVFCDDDRDGEWDENEDTAIMGVSVTLTKVGETIAYATTSTLATGMYSFLEVPVGDWIVAVATDQTALLNKTIDGAAELDVTVIAGEDQPDNDFLFCCAGGEISGQVYCDNDADESFVAPPDIGLAGVTVVLEDADGVEIDSTTTLDDGMGSYTFGVRPQAGYIVSVDPAQTALDGTSVLGSMSEEITVECGADVTVDFRFQCRGYVSGRVIRESVDCNGDVDDGELGIGGVTVVLTRTDGTSASVQTTTTSTTGTYDFRPVDPGQYMVSVALDQANVVLLKANVPDDGVLSPIVVEPRSGSEDNDFYFCPAELTVRVFKKARGKACLNEIIEGDTPIQDVEVEISGPSGATGTTNEFGEVTFTNLDAGTYTVTVDGTQTPLSTYIPAFGAASQTRYLPAGQLEVVDSVWCDDTCSIRGKVIKRGGECVTWWPAGGILGVKVELRKESDDSLVATETTLADGSFLFSDVLDDDYVVSIPAGQAVLALMEALTETSYLVTCGANKIFEYGSAGLWVNVLIDVDCGGTADGGLAGVTVTMTKKDAPGLGLVFKADTDANGAVQFPTTAMDSLPAGLYDVSIPAQGKLIPKGPLTQTITLATCVPDSLTFEFCDVGSLVGYVILETVDCNGERQDTEDGIPGVEVVLIGITDPTFSATIDTDVDGYYFFTNLRRGEYEVSVNGSQPEVVNFKPVGTLDRSVTIIPVAEEREDFFFCPPARIHGRVFVNGLEFDCDAIYGTGDEPLVGVVVDLIVDGGIVDSIPTGPDGTYSFEPLDPGTYTVAVDGFQAQVVNLAPQGDLLVGPFVLEPQGDEEIDFPFCKQAIRGTVFREPAGNCEGILDDGDGRIQFVEVDLLLLDGEQAGLTRQTTTDENGEYEFADIPAGLYQITVDGSQPELVGLSLTTDEVLTPTLLAGEIVTDQDFGYCPLLGSICGQVFLNDIDSDCDQVFDDGDEPLVGVTVVLRHDSGDDAGKEVAKTTDTDGGFCFYELEAGDYTVFVEDGQTQIVGLDPQEPTRELPIYLPAGGEEEIDFPYCDEECEEDCCEGDLHEVVVETKFWIGCMGEDWEDEWFDIYAYFWDGCVRGADEIDYAGVYYKGEFPGAVTGYNDVLTLESARVVDGFMIVRLRLTAQGCAFPRGFFGKKCRTIGVQLNGRMQWAHSSFRCECLRPGTWFTWTECCGFPECGEDFTSAQLDAMILDGAPASCQALFLARETQSWENWIRCDVTPPECKTQSETCKCGYNQVEFELDYWMDRDGDNSHRFELDLEKWGTKLIDELTLRFTGNEWYGMKKSERGLVFLKSVRKLSYSEAVALYGEESPKYFDLWRATILVRACDRMDGNPRALPEQLEFNTKLDTAERKYWLDLNNTCWWDSCLELGMRTWDGKPDGVSITRWLSVEDAAWCEPYECTWVCDGCGMYCKYCPEPAADCDCDEQTCDECETQPEEVACGCGR